MSFFNKTRNKKRGIGLITYMHIDTFSFKSILCLFFKNYLYFEVLCIHTCNRNEGNIFCVKFLVLIYIFYIYIYFIKSIIYHTKLRNYFQLSILCHCTKVYCILTTVLCLHCTSNAQCKVKPQIYAK